MLKKICFVLLFLTIVCCGCTQKEDTKTDALSQIKNRGQLIVGVKTDTPPFGYINKEKQNIGFDIDLAKYLTKKLLGDESKLILVPVDTSNRIKKLSSNEVDMVIATMSVTPQRQILLDFSVPYHTAGQAMMVRANSKITSLMELSGKKAIIVFGSTVERSIHQTIPNVTVIGYKNYPDAVAALKAGVGDAMIADDTILLGFAMNDNSLKMIPKKYTKEPYAVAFRKGEESERLIDFVDMELKELINRGKIKKMKAKWGIS